MSTRTRSTLPSRDLEVQGQHAPPGLDGDAVLPRQAVVVEVLGHAPDAVAAHLALGAVGIEHPHPGVGPFRGHDEDQAVGADAEVPVADGHRQAGGIGRGRLPEGLDVDVVVADPVHLGEFHRKFDPR